MRATLGRIGPATFGIDTQAPDYPAWQPNILAADNPVGSRWLWEGITYQTIQPHDTQEGWEPPNVPALYKVHRLPFALWVQPEGSHDAYEALDDDGAPTTCTYNGQGWVNVHGNGNVWPPGEFGWEPIAIPESVAAMWVDNPTDRDLKLRIVGNGVDHQQAAEPGTHDLRIEGPWDDLPDVDEWSVWGMLL